MGVWNNYWVLTNKNFIFSIGLRMHHRIVFSVYESFFDGLNLDNPSIIELGSGCGELTARLVKKYGGSATLVDNSRKALNSAKSVFNDYSINVKLLERDLFKFDPKEKYDIVHSEGLIEHFIGDDQNKIVHAHKKCAKKGGYVLISVPRPAWYYRIAKGFLEMIGKWPFGYENAMNKYALKKVMENNGMKVIRFAERARYSFALAKI
ncbi:MAG: class I SAM-dependent methyltransferase [Candidatus Aenigmatarchaeota archaeon]